MIHITKFAWMWPDHPSGMCFAVFNDDVLLALCPAAETANIIRDEAQRRLDAGQSGDLGFV